MSAPIYPTEYFIRAIGKRIVVLCALPIIGAAVAVAALREISNALQA